MHEIIALKQLDVKNISENFDITNACAQQSLV